MKLHYPRRLSRFTRRLRRPIITVQLWVAAELDRVGVPFLPEVGGGVFGTDPTQAWGYLLREQRLAHAEPTAATVPMFALYGTDVRSPDDPTLLEQLVVRSGLPAGRLRHRSGGTPDGAALGSGGHADRVRAGDARPEHALRVLPRR